MKACFNEKHITDDNNALDNADNNIDNNVDDNVDKNIDNNADDNVDNNADNDALDNVDNNYILNATTTENWYHRCVVSECITTLLLLNKSVVHDL